MCKGGFFQCEPESNNDFECTRPQYVKRVSINYCRFNQDQHGAGNVVTVFKLIQARCRYISKLEVRHPLPRAAPPRPSTPVSSSGADSVRRIDKWVECATGTRQATRPNGNPPHATQIMMDFLEWYFCTPVTAHYRMCVLSGCVPRKITAFFYCSSLRLWEMLGCHSRFTSPLGPNLLYCNVGIFGHQLFRVPSGNISCVRSTCLLVTTTVQ